MSNCNETIIVAGYARAARDFAQAAAQSACIAQQSIGATGATGAIGPVTATGTITPRTVENRFAEVFNVRDFGAVGNGTTNDGPAFQLAFNAANSAGGGVVFIPKGRYRRADTAGSQWTMYSNTSLVGEGDQSVIFFDDSPSQVRSGNDLIYANNTVNVEFKNFKVEGTLLSNLSDINIKQCFCGDTIENLRFENITMVGLRYMATAFNNVKNGIFTNNRLEYIARDGLRATSSQNIIYSNNTLKAVVDDAIVFSGYNVDIPPQGGCVITGNTLEACQGIKALGGKELVISNNIFRRTIRNPIYIETPSAPQIEGQTNIVSINITGNTICDTIGNRGTNFAIIISYSGGRNKLALAQQPGVSTSPYEYNYLTNINNTPTVKPGYFGINISNNIISRTLGDVAEYSDWGYGLLFDRVNNSLGNQVGFYDPQINLASQITHGIIVSGAVNGLNISNNIISGTSFTGINFVNTTNTNIIDYNNVTISQNTFIDVVYYGLFCNNSGSGTGASNFLIFGNTFDIDPFYRNANHLSDNTWSTTSGGSGIVNLFLNGLYISNNVFKNCSSIYQGVIPYPSGKNFIYADFTAGGVNDSGINKGIRLIPAFKNNIVIPIDGDPTSATYGQIRNAIVTSSFTMPAFGYYIRGTFVENANPVITGTAGSQYTLSGWWRATTGNAHVLNTDWIEVRALTGT